MPIPRTSRVSRAALLSTAALHLALLWLALQSAPMVQTVRAVVRYLAPITLPTEKPLAPISPRPAPIPKALTPVLPPAPVKPQAIELPSEKPLEIKPPPIERKLEPIAPPPVPREPVRLEPPPPFPAPVLP